MFLFSLLIFHAVWLPESIFYMTLFNISQGLFFICSHFSPRAHHETVTNLKSLLVFFFSYAFLSALSVTNYFTFLPQFNQSLMNFASINASIFAFTCNFSLKKLRDIAIRISLWRTSIMIIRVIAGLRSRSMLGVPRVTH